MLLAAYAGKGRVGSSVFNISGMKSTHVGDERNQGHFTEFPTGKIFGGTEPTGSALSSVGSRDRQTVLSGLVIKHSLITNSYREHYFFNLFK